MKTKSRLHAVAFAMLLVASLFLSATVNHAEAATIAITSPITSQVLASGNVIVSGTATPNATVIVYKGSKPVGSVASDGSGAWSLTVSGLGAGSHTLRAKVIDDDGYAYFAAAGGTNSINRLRMSDNALNPGGGAWPVTTTDARLIPSSIYSSNGTNYFYVPGDPAALPGKFDPDNPLDFDDVAGYPATPGLSTGGFNESGTKWYGVNAGSDSVSVVDVATNTHVVTIPVGDEPQSSRLGPDDKFYVSNSADGTISVIDTNTDSVIDTLNVTSCPTSGSLGNMLFPEGEDYFYAACAVDGVIFKLDITDGSLISTFDISSQHGSISSMFVSPDNKKLYIFGIFGTPYADNAAIVDAATGDVEQVITLSGDTFSGTLSPDGKYLYVATQGSAFNMTNIDVVSTTTGTIVDTIDTSSVGTPGVISYDEPSSAVSQVSFVLGSDSDESDSSEDDSQELAQTGFSQISAVIVATVLAGLTVLIARIRKAVQYRILR